MMMLRNIKLGYIIYSMFNDNRLLVKTSQEAEVRVRQLLIALGFNSIRPLIIKNTISHSVKAHKQVYLRLLNKP